MNSSVQKKAVQQSDDGTQRQEPVITRLVPLSFINYHVFQWICQSDCVDVDAMVEEAFATAEEGRPYCTSNGSVPDTVCPRLSELLYERLSDWEAMWVPRVSDGRFSYADEVDWLMDPDATPDPDLDFGDLFVPVLHSAWGGISSDAVAEAILRYKGRWDD